MYLNFRANKAKIEGLIFGMKIQNCVTFQIFGFSRQKWTKLYQILIFIFGI